MQAEAASTARARGRASGAAGWRLALLLGLACTAPAAQAWQDEALPMRFERLAIDDGLSQNAVNRIAQDRTGFMWFATESGLNRYDGYQFLQFRRELGTPGALANDFITDLAVATDGSLWAATDGGGLARRAADSERFETWRHDPDDPAALPADNLRRLLADRHGGLWVGTMRSGLSRLDPASGSFTHYRHAADNAATLSDDRIYALWQDDDGYVWVGTGRGLDRLNPDTGMVVRFELPSVAAGEDGRVMAIFRDSYGSLWIGTANQGLGRLDETTGEIALYRHEPQKRASLPGDRVEAILEDSSGRLWVGTNAGLALMDRGRDRFAHYRHEPADPRSLGDSNVISLYEDRGGVLWVGTKTGGLSKWNSRSWAFGHRRTGATADGNPAARNVTSFARTGDGALLIGTFGGGIHVFDHAREQPPRPVAAEVAAALSDQRVMALATGPGGNAWAGTMQGGLNRIDFATGTVRVYRHEPGNPRSLASNGIMSLYVSSRGELWIGTFGGGVSRYRPETDDFDNYAHDAGDPTSLSSPNATAIGEDGQGRIWVGTSSGGLNRLNDAGDGWQHFRHDPHDRGSLSSNAIYALHRDASGTLWIGTRAGLNRFVPRNNSATEGQFYAVARQQGLANDVVYGVRSDGRGGLWLSTNYGISRFDPRTGSVRNYHAGDGLQGEELHCGAPSAATAGTLYFGGSNGFNAFDPDAIVQASTPPAVVLTQVSKLNEPVDLGQPLSGLESLGLAYTDDMVSFEFAALDYAAPGKNVYAYMLEGFDADWVEAGNERRATYTNLSGGDYVFRVRAANSYGAWNEAGVSLDVAVDHPPWLTWWAYTLYALAIVGSVLLLVLAQKRKLARETEYSKRLEHEVRERTDLLAQRNAELKMANVKLKDASLTDALTGLRNRRYLFEEIGKDISLIRRHHGPGGRDPERNNDLVFMMVDLDNFKPVNDSCGHAAGDQMLMQVRDALQNACRDSDVVIRWGGDEFLVVGRETTHEEASVLAERIRSRIAQTVYSVGGGQVARTTASIGFASYPFIEDQPDLLSWEQVLNIADAAMYRAKEERNGWFGIHGNSWSGNGESLLRAIKTGADELAENGDIRIERSLSVAASRTA